MTLKEKAIEFLSCYESSQTPWTKATHAPHRTWKAYGEACEPLEGACVSGAETCSGLSPYCPRVAVISAHGQVSQCQTLQMHASEILLTDLCQKRLLPVILSRGETACDATCSAAAWPSVHPGGCCWTHCRPVEYPLRCCDRFAKQQRRLVRYRLCATVPTATAQTLRLHQPGANAARAACATASAKACQA